MISPIDLVTELMKGVTDRLVKYNTFVEPEVTLVLLMDEPGIGPIGDRGPEIFFKKMCDT